MNTDSHNDSGLTSKQYEQPMNEGMQGNTMMMMMVVIIQMVTMKILILREAPLRKTQGLFGHCPNSD